jgi:hypothetical protein
MQFCGECQANGIPIGEKKRIEGNKRSWQAADQKIRLHVRLSKGAPRQTLVGVSTDGQRVQSRYFDNNPFGIMVNPLHALRALVQTKLYSPSPQKVHWTLVFPRRKAMKTMFLLAVALLLSTGSAFVTVTVQKWTAGWDNFSEPLNFSTSKISWSVNPTTRKLSVTFTLVGATPSKLYQVGINIFCTTFPATFGQFPTDGGGGTCQSLTRQGVTKTLATVELGVVTTDIHGNGSFNVSIGPITAGTYGRRIPGAQWCGLQFGRRCGQ